MAKAKTSAKRGPVLPSPSSEDASLQPGRLTIFLSWSKDRSRLVANALSQWLRILFPDVEPWVSTQDVSAGERWADSISSKLEASNLGIICLTPENLNEPWVLFEAGALSKSVDSSRVIPYLLNLKPSDVSPPLGQFQALQADEVGTLNLLKAINLLRSQPHGEAELKGLFEGMWPRLKLAIQSIPTVQSPSKSARSERDMLGELVDLARDIHANLDKFRLINLDLAELGKERKWGRKRSVKENIAAPSELKAVPYSDFADFLENIFSDSPDNKNSLVELFRASERAKQQSQVK